MCSGKLRDYCHCNRVHALQAFYYDIPTAPFAFVYDIDMEVRANLRSCSSM
jgi:hypothetical protein